MSTLMKQKVTKVNPFFQIGALLISSIIIGLALYINLFTFHTHETYTPLKKVTHDKIALWGATPQPITVGLYIKQFQEFNILKNYFIFSGTLWFLCDPPCIDLRTLKQFDFEQGEILHLSEPHTKEIDGKQMVQYNVKVAFHSAIDHRYFPLDDHRLYFVLAHDLFEPKDITFNSSHSDFTINDSVQTSGWQMIGHEVDCGYIHTKFDVNDTRKTRHYPAVAFSIDYARCARRYVVSILIPLLFLFFLGLFSFSVDNKATIALSTASITGAMGYRYVIERLSPASGHFMFSDYIFFIFLIAVCVAFVLNIVDVYAHPLTIRQKQCAVIGLHAFVDLTSIYFLVWW
jgi:hypothetical protein